MWTLFQSPIYSCILEQGVGSSDQNTKYVVPFLTVLILVLKKSTRNRLWEPFFSSSRKQANGTWQAVRKRTQASAPKRWSCWLGWLQVLVDLGAPTTRDVVKITSVWQCRLHRMVSKNCSGKSLTCSQGHVLYEGDILLFCLVSLNILWLQYIYS